MPLLALVTAACQPEPVAFEPRLAKRSPIAAIAAPIVNAVQPDQASSDSPASPAPSANAFYGMRFDPAFQCSMLSGAPGSGIAARAPSRRPMGYGALEELPGDVLSSGDLVELTVVEGEMFSGSFVVGSTGVLSVPHLPPIRAAGRTPQDVEQAIERALVQEQYFKPHAANVELALRQLGEISVSVSGAVFGEGLVSAGERSPKTRDDAYDNASGADNWRRRLSGVLKAAGGIRPDADLSRVTLRRGGEIQEYDMTGIFTGGELDDPLVVDGDYVQVPPTQCFSPDLIRPTRITPPGISVTISNPTGSASSSTQLEGPTVSMPYGSRLADALVAGGCIGGPRVANRGRYAVIVGRNAATDTPEVMRVETEDVILRPDRADLNPHLQAGDAIACYDGELINVRAVASVAGSVLSTPQLMLRLLGL